MSGVGARRVGLCRLGSWVSQFLLSAGVGIVRLIVVISGGWGNSCNIWKGSGGIINKAHPVDGGQ